MVLVLTIAVYFISNIIKAKREIEAEDLRLELLHALSGATLQLNTRNWQQPMNLLDRYNEFSTQFNTMITQFLTQVSALEQRQHNDLQTFANFKHELTANMKTMAAAAAEMKGSIHDFKQSIMPLVTSAQTLTTQQGSLLKSADEATSSFKQQIAAQNKVVQEQEKWGKDLNSALATLKMAMEQDKTLLKEFTDRQTKLTGEQGRLVTAMKEVHKELAAFVRQTADSLKRLLGDTGESYKELKALNIQMDDLVRRVAAALPPPPPSRIGR
jgi:chromosome segregation ATPase